MVNDSARHEVYRVKQFSDGVFRARKRFFECSVFRDNGDGKITERISEKSHTIYRYDLERGYLVEKREKNFTADHTVNSLKEDTRDLVTIYTYFPNGHISSITNPEGKTTTYSYSNPGPPPGEY